MSTLRQKRLAKAIIENSMSDDPMNKGELLESVGYDPTTATARPGEVIAALGVQEELRKYGFDEESAKKVVIEVMNDKKDNAVRLRAAAEVFKVFGSYAAEKSFNMTVNTSVEELNNKIKEDLARFRTNE